MRISVIIPSFNSEKTIARALNSCLSQTIMPYEIIVVDDASTDHTLEILNKYAKDKAGRLFKIIKLEVNRGPSHARNIGWDISSGDYIAFLDSDDMWHPKKIEIITGILNDNPDVDLLGHSFDILDIKESKYEGINYKDDILLKNINFWDLLVKNLFATPCVVLRRNIEMRFDETMRQVEDHDLWLRIASIYSLCYLSCKLARLGHPQLSKGGLSEDRIKMRIGEMKMYLKISSYKKGAIILLPFLLVYSLAKYFIKVLANLKISIL